MKLPKQTFREKKPKVKLHRVYITRDAQSLKQGAFSGSSIYTKINNTIQIDDIFDIYFDICYYFFKVKFFKFLKKT